MNWLNNLRIALIGFCMGVADLIPGVSGGTVAFVCGIYDRLIEAIKCFDVSLLRQVLGGRFKEAWARVPVVFLVSLGAGLLTAIFTLSKVLAALFKSHPVELWSFFFGLILGSIVLLTVETWKWRPKDAVAFVVATIATYWLVGLDAVQTPATPLYLFVAGFIAISAMILPGISGSYLLVIMGKYQQVLDAVNSRDIASLAIFVAGIVAGILSLVRIVSWLLRKWRQTTLVALTGIMAGALRTVWPWKEVLTTRLNSHGEVVPVTQRNILPADPREIAVALVLLAVGAVVVLGLSRLNPGKTEKSA
ncbi:MAG: DUF368 domain-containing protein [Verrucomicrobiota bacterium]